MLRLSSSQFQKITEQGLAGKPLEICGLLAGRRSADSALEESTFAEVLEIYPIDSEDQNEKTYTLNPLQQLRAEKDAAAKGMEIIGIYHTHPATQPYPSPTDVKRAHWGDTDDLMYPDYSFLIVSLRQPETPEPRSFYIRGARIPEDIVEEEVVITPDA
jgi:proteasome lid subunit RPN8/RPN11